MIKYVFRETPLTIKAADKADAQRIGSELAKLTEAANGRLTPKAIVEAAQDRRSPLHPHFEWDDAKAAEAYRLEQAREIVRCIRIEDEEAENPRAFLSITDKAGTAYRALGEVQSSRALQLLVLHQAERDLDAFNRRYRELEEICATIRIAKDQVVRRRADYESGSLA